MKYRLGLDLGVGSIGSAVVELDEQNNVIDIKDAGVRIFDVSEGAEERRQKRTARKNNVRTKKRLKLLAQKLYENNLWVNDLPEGTNRLKSKSPYKIRYDAINEKLDNPNYIGRAILHLAKHRGAGFVSAIEGWEEEVLDDGEKSKKKPTSYDNMVSHLQETHSRTIGEYFYKRLIDITDKEKRHIRQGKYALEKNIVDYAIPRYLVKDEFNLLWDTQAKYFSQMQKDGLKQEIYNILFYERPAVPYAIGKCVYFRNEDRLAKAHPLSEMRRIYEEVNNVRISTNDMPQRRLTIEERDKIINEILLQGKNAGKNAIKKLLNLSAQNRISLQDDKVIKAYLYSTPNFAEIDYIKQLSDQQLSDFIEFLSNPINPNDKNGRLYSEDELIGKLKNILKIDDEKKVGDLLTKLPKGRTMLGITATKTILAELQKHVLSHREITDRLKKNDSHFEAAEEVARAKQGKCDSLPYYGIVLPTDTQPLPPTIAKYKRKLAETLTGKERESMLNEVNYGKIANPAVHMILNQIRLVVNDIIRIYGRPYDINLELGRDVGMSTQKKNQLEQRQKTNEKLNEEAIQYLKDRKLFVNNKNILKYKLAKEQKWTDAYNPQIEIPQNFSGFEIEHIVPRSQGGTDTYNNLCLVSRNDNLNKGDMFAYDYFDKKYEDNPEIIRAIIKNARERMPEKAWRFEADAREHFEENGDDEETNRYLTDTRYVSKMAARYLRAIIASKDDEDVVHTRILPVKGGQTAELRKRWNLLGLEYDLMGMTNSVPRYLPCDPYWINSETGEIVEGTDKPNIDGNWIFRNKEKNKEWMAKPRIDHRHHAMDAITVACCNRSLIKRMADEINISHLQTDLPMLSVSSVGDFRRRVIDVLKNINVSHKPNHSKNGQFHKETGRIVLCKNPEDENALITVYSRKVLSVIKSYKDLNKLLIPDTIKNEWHQDILSHKEAQAKLVKDFELYINTAEQILIAEKNQAIAEGKKETKITEARILTKAFRIIQEKGLWKGDSFKCYENNSALVYIPKHGLAYEGRNNHCVDFYKKDGKIGWEVIKRFDINQKDFEPQWKKDGGKIIWSVQQGDIMELDTPDEWQSYTDKERCLARVKKFSSGEFNIDYITDARMTSPKDKKITYLFVNTLRKGLSFLTQHKARKVELTAFGKIKKKHKVLWDGKKTEA